MSFRTSKVAEFDIIYGKGISKCSEIVDIAVELEIISKSGSWYSYEGNRIGQGRENAVKYLESNPEIMEEIENKIRAESDKLDMTVTNDVLSEDDDNDDE